MKFTIDAGSALARAIRDREGADMTLSIVAHDPTYGHVDRFVTARLMSWTILAGCAHRGEVMEVEWMDLASLQRLAFPDLPT